VLSDPVVCLVTAPPAAAPQLAALAVEKELAACANIVPLVHSIYRWQGAIQTDEESLLLLKTTSAAIPHLEQLLRKHHPYDTFELVALDIAGGSPPYLEWVAASVDSTADDLSR
jgi:periplasmic divalent cation tolerance protein